MLRWAETYVGLLHRSTEHLAESRFSQHIPGYLSRLDYVAHIQLELQIMHVLPRSPGTSRSSTPLLHHSALLANHTLNCSCSLADLGGLSWILWGFEDRESIFSILEASTGARMHNWVDSSLPSFVDSDSGSWLFPIFISSCRNVSLLDTVLVRHSLSRIYGVINMDFSCSLSSCFTGPLLFSSGLSSDARIQCLAYVRACVSSQFSGSLSCSYMRILIRLFCKIFTHWTYLNIIFNPELLLINCSQVYLVLIFRTPWYLFYKYQSN